MCVSHKKIHMLERNEKKPMDIRTLPPWAGANRGCWKPDIVVRGSPLSARFIKPDSIGFPELCAWGFLNFREKILYFLSPKRQNNPPTIWICVHEKMEQSKGKRRLEATQPGQLLEAQSNTPTSRSAGIAPCFRRLTTAMWHNEAKIASINVRRKDVKGSD